MKQPTNLLPRPWRLLFEGQPDLASDDPLYRRLASYAVTPFRPMPVEALETWDVDQTKGQFTATLTNDITLTADMQLLGTHDGHTFLWANNNPSIDQQLATVAIKTREALNDEFPQAAKNDRLFVGQRDVSTLLSYAGELTDAEMTFNATSGDTSVYLTLHNVQQPNRPQKQSLLGRLSGRKAEPAFDLSSIMQMMNNQWQQHLLTPDALLALEPHLNAAKALFDAGQLGECAKTIARINEQMGPHANGQEPTGWTFFCDALCALNTGDRDAAEQSLRIASRAIVPPARVRTLLAGARCGNWSDSRIIGAYVSDPDLFTSLASPAEQEVLRDAIVTAMDGRRDVADDPVSVLNAANMARHETACRAWDVAEAASAQRSEAHVYCDADYVAEEENAAHHRNLLLRWFSPHRNPSAASISSDPKENPDRCEKIELISHTSENAMLVATYGVPYSDDSKDRYRYVLERTAIPFSETVCWRISEIWSLWDNGDIRMH